MCRPRTAACHQTTSKTQNERQEQVKPTRPSTCPSSTLSTREWLKTRFHNQPDKEESLTNGYTGKSRPNTSKPVYTRLKSAKVSRPSSARPSSTCSYGPNTGAFKLSSHREEMRNNGDDSNKQNMHLPLHQRQLQVNTLSNRQRPQSSRTATETKEQRPSTRCASAGVRRPGSGSQTQVNVT